MKPLVNFYDGEPWFDNPQLVIANPKRRKKSMTKRRTRRGRKNSPRRVRRNFYSAGLLSNRPRRKARRNRKRRTMRSNIYFPLNPRHRRRHHRSFGSNPRKFLGFEIPPMDAVLFATAGLIGPNLVSQQILAVMPASWKTGADGKPNQITMWATKVLSVALPAWAIRKFIGARQGNMFLVGGLAALTLDAIKTFAPGIIPGIGAQPLLGAYFDAPRAVVNFPRNTSRVPQMIADAPGRLDPQERY